MSESDPTFGVKPFCIAGRMQDRRLRCMGMTDEERRWRAQWLKDQVLSPEEPRYEPEYYKQTTNFFRRLWKSPFNSIEKSLKPSLGSDGAFVVRHGIGKGIVAVAVTYLTVYYFKYHTNDFTIYKPIEVFSPRPIMYPDHPDYPNYPEKTATDYYDQGFYSSVLCQDVEIEEPPPPPPPEIKLDPSCPALEGATP